MVFSTWHGTRKFFLAWQGRASDVARRHTVLLYWAVCNDSTLSHVFPNLPFPYNFCLILPIARLAESVAWPAAPILGRTSLACALEECFWVWLRAHKSHFTICICTLYTDADVPNFAPKSTTYSGWEVRKFSIGIKVPLLSLNCTNLVLFFVCVLWTLRASRLWNSCAVTFPGAVFVYLCSSASSCTPRLLTFSHCLLHCNATCQIFFAFLAEPFEK